ncbi:MAG: alpha-galactosidase, partial [Mobilitalea sp.]
MKVELLKEYTFGDMVCRYYIDMDSKNVELMLLPAGIDPLEWNSKKQSIDSLVQIKITGDIYGGAYAGGSTMRQGETVTRLKYIEQKAVVNSVHEEIITVLE